MRVLFRGIGDVLRCAIKTSTGCFFMLFVLQLSFLAGTAHSQERDSVAYENKMMPNGIHLGLDNHKFLYGIHLGFTENKVDIYSTQGGTLHASDEHSFYTGGIRIAVIGEAQLGRCFSLRAMPGVTLFSGLKMESTRGELPVDIKFHPVRIENLRPYLATGIGYGFDFSSLRDDGHNYIKPLNAHDLRYTCSLGVDWYTRVVRVGLELKAGFGLLPLGTGGSNFSYFHNGHTFCIGLNIEG